MRSRSTCDNPGAIELTSLRLISSRLGIVARRGREDQLVEARSAHEVWVHRHEEVVLGAEVTLDRGHRDSRLTRDGGDGHAGDAAGHHPDGPIQDPRSRPLGLLSRLVSMVRGG